MKKADARAQSFPAPIDVCDGAICQNEIEKLTKLRITNESNEMNYINSRIKLSQTEKSNER